MFHANLHRKRITDESERRTNERQDCAAEVVIAWNHDLTERIRLRSIDISETGMRVVGTMPILEGMSGIAISILPEGIDLNKVFVVKWVEHEEDSEEYTAGLEFLS